MRRMITWVFVMPQRSLMRVVSPGHAAHRAVALVVVILFSFQLSRFYLTAELNPLECLEHDHSHDTTSAHSHDATSAHLQAHSHEAASEHSHPHQQQRHHESESMPESEDNGHYFQHCKDTFAAMGLTPVQPLGMAVAVVRQPQTQVSVAALTEDIRPTENFLLPPFHPPRHLG